MNSAPLPVTIDRAGGPSLARRSVGTRLLGIAAALMLLQPGSARADLKLCNETSSRVGIAIGYKDKSTGDWVTEGWWNILSHACETMLPGVLQARFYYVHAIDYDRGGAWSGKDKMCTAGKSFTIRGVGNCSDRGLEQTGFYEVDTGEANDYTIKLIDPVEGGAGAQ